MLKFLITEYCPGPFYMGWHLYLRDSTKKQQRNEDGSWGWIRRVNQNDLRADVQAIFDSLGITIRSDGSCDDDGLAEIARRYPIPRSKIGGKPRGCIPVEEDETGNLTLAHK